MGTRTRRLTATVNHSAVSVASRSVIGHAPPRAIGGAVSGAVFGVLTVTVLGALLTGCSAGSSESPITSQQRTAIRTALLQAEWDEVKSQYPEAIRPPVQLTATVPDEVSSRPLVACLRGRGIAATGYSGTVVYSSSNGQTPVEVAVSFYSCRAGNPTTSLVSWYLNDLQSSALSSYYAHSVRPCLLSAGAPSPPPPRSAARTISGFPVATAWNPYLQVWASALPPAALETLEHRCPPLPAWLNLGSG